MNFKIVLTAVLAFVATIAFSQTTTGKISYDVYLSSDNPQMSAYIEQMETSLMEVYFVDGKLRTDFFMGEMSTTNSISIKGMDSTLVLLDNMYMGKVAMKVTESDGDDESAMGSKVKSVELFPEETKEVIGYKCKKAIVTYEDGFQSEVWYTEAIVPSFRKGQYIFEEIPGLPLEFNSRGMMNMDMKIVAFDFKDKLSKKQISTLFDLSIPKGYTLKTLEELKQVGGN